MHLKDKKNKGKDMRTLSLMMVLVCTGIAGCASTERKPIDYEALVVEQGAEAAFPELKQAADSGDPAAMMSLANLYERDWEGETSKSQALRYYRLAQETGSEMAADRYQALYDAGVRETRAISHYGGMLETSVFEWVSPKEGGAGSKPGHAGLASGLSGLDVLQENAFVQAQGQTTSGRLYRSVNATGIDHEPDGGYSRWILPNFYPVDSESMYRDDWRRTRFSFSFDPDRAWSEFELPLEIRTNLAPENKVSVILYNTGEVAIKTATRPGESFLQHESAKVFDGNGPIELEFWNNLDGDWRLLANGSLAGSGRIAPEKVTGGLSNHFFIEGDITIDSLAISEGHNREKASPAVLDTKRHARLEQAILERFMDNWIGAYMGEGASASDHWHYKGHERIYLRRTPFSWRRIVRDATKDGPDLLGKGEVDGKRMLEIYQWLPAMARPQNSYLVSLLVTVENPQGESMRFPAQYMLGVVDAEADWLGLKLLFNQIDESGDNFYFGNGADMEKGDFRSLFEAENI
ncbi:MAG: hypothetical protein R6W86_11185 [Marinobacter sp.]|uniref:tetratricopeptide repeat protein n=1 Tax=Marinobacter sp. TaxID=50741 RepID=UPI00396E7ADD